MTHSIGCLLSAAAACCCVPHCLQDDARLQQSIELLKACNKQDPVKQLALLHVIACLITLRHFVCGCLEKHRVRVPKIRDQALVILLKAAASARRDVELKDLVRKICGFRQPQVLGPSSCAAPHVQELLHAQVVAALSSAGQQPNEEGQPSNSLEHFPVEVSRNSNAGRLGEGGGGGGGGTCWLQACMSADSHNRVDGVLGGSGRFEGRGCCWLPRNACWDCGAFHVTSGKRYCPDSECTPQYHRKPHEQHYCRRLAGL